MKPFLLGAFAGLAMHVTPAFSATSLIDLGFSASYNAGWGGDVLQSYEANTNNSAGFEILFTSTQIGSGDVQVSLFSDAARTNSIGTDTQSVTPDIMPGFGAARVDLVRFEWAPVAITAGLTYYLFVDLPDLPTFSVPLFDSTTDSYTKGEATLFPPSLLVPRFRDIAGAKGLYDPEFGKDDQVDVVPLPAGAILLVSGLAVLASRRRKLSS